MIQSALHRAEIISGYKIYEVSGVRNCQIEDCCLNYLHDAKILHFYAVGGSGKTTTHILREDNNIIESMRMAVFLMISRLQFQTHISPTILAVALFLILKELFGLKQTQCFLFIETVHVCGKW